MATLDLATVDHATVDMHGHSTSGKTGNEDYVCARIFKVAANLHFVTTKVGRRVSRNLAAPANHSEDCELARYGCLASVEVWLSATYYISFSNAGLSCKEYVKFDRRFQLSMAAFGLQLYGSFISFGHTAAGFIGISFLRNWERWREGKNKTKNSR